MKFEYICESRDPIVYHFFKFSVSASLISLISKNHVFEAGKKSNVMKYVISISNYCFFSEFQ